jgi:hypothetical protein
MNYVPINGLRMLAVEGGILLAASIVSFLSLKFLPPPRRPRWLQWIVVRNSRSVLFVIAVALIARALLLPILGIPEPRINDEYSYLLMADTFSHFRLTNATPAAWQHFETFHVTLTPTYHSKYPVAQGLALAFGQVVFHRPWIGVYLSTALLCGAICWALQAFVPPYWALLGGMLAVVRFALFSYWMNSYWGGSVPAIGGTVALGAALRLSDADRPQRRYWFLASAFTIALLVLAISRPYEGLAFSIPLLAYLGYRAVRRITRGEKSLWSTVLLALVIGFLGVVLMGYYNWKTTKNPFLLPYVLNERIYSTIPQFYGQKAKPEPPARDPVFPKYCAVEAQEHGYQQTKSLPQLIGLEMRRLGANWFFYVGPALTFPVLLGFLLCVRQPRLWIATIVTLTTGVAVALCIFSQYHYFSPATIAVYVFAVVGLQHLWQQGGNGERAFVMAVCLTVAIASLTRQTASTANSAYFFPDTRKSITQQLESKPGKHLVLVSYDIERHYPGDELVHNGADFGSAKILWARSKGSGKDSDLCRAYPDRNFWSLTTDDVSVSFTPVDFCPNR